MNENNNKHLENTLLKNTLKMMCPPGAGVFTVNTAKEKKENLWQTVYKTTSNVEDLWHKSILSANSETFLLGVCSDCGGGIQRGANWGPLFIREAILKNYPELNYSDFGDIRVIPHLLHDKYLNDETLRECREALYGDKNIDLPVSPLSITEKVCDDFYRIYPNKKLFALGGDHSVSYPLVKSYLKHKKNNKKKVALIHFDAHTDLLKKRLGIDICFGSWVSHILDGLESPNLCYQFGIRSSGKDRGHWEDEFKINQIWTEEIKKFGAYEIATKACSDLLKNGVEELYVSFDIDALDSSIAAATGTPEDNGLDLHECMTILKVLNEKIKITGADLVEVAPMVGLDKMAQIKTLEASSVISRFLIEALNNANN